MNELLDFYRYLLAVGLLVAGCAALWRNVSRHYAQQAEIRRLNSREAELSADLTRERERHFELTIARDFADSDGAGYIDRTGLEGP
jgi:hypothetical protein